ncbi:hypothetical protein [Agrococcus jenensis]|uniref:Uncharacterized protein n=1 Tax=Agrococcus jenensis TaxID=46353 RepID=A0A3N2AQM4_9MICO|nr:hypothetical protein [Agrococcus jenensis]ROR65349.1 hypothetical protein EDD26_0715 [Agrococcus jenensis]
MRSTHHRPRAALALLAAGAALVVSGCATPVEVAPQVTPASSWQQVETQTGSARFRIPPGWTVEDRSRFMGEDMVSWVNVVALLDEGGEQQLVYVDEPVLSSAYAWDEPVLSWFYRHGPSGASAAGDGLVVEREASEGRVVTGWWEEAVSCGLLCEWYYIPHLAVIDPAAGPSRTLTTEQSDGSRRHAFGLRRAPDGTDPSSYDSPDEVARFVSGEQGQLLQAVLSTLELHSVPLSAFPAGASPPADVRETFAYDGPLERFTTADGAIAFDVPHLHTVVDESTTGPGAEHRIRVVEPFGETVLTITDGTSPPLDPTVGSGVITVIEQRRIDERLAATSWLIQSERGVTAHIALTELGTENPVGFVPLADGRALVVHAQWWTGGCAMLSGVSEARECLAEVGPAALLDAIESIELDGG